MYNRSAIKRIPGRLAFLGRSFYSKLGTTIDRDLVYSQMKVGAAGLGNTDNRDAQAHYTLNLAATNCLSNGT